ncbi:hypothetical protein MGYG_08918 [Nannizzia gypsea CBS 118893]|uniref:Uncharacterized protein n=1 Tax=Arthroderma gypseum (strain ATCC MYA-4604 / CBS 118893) TaxID=535722 RepID=E5QYV4_ARTGP|nr:hypothetical protein MGYG_08918 [Nannizzia gypsea CBS 118893]EFQ98077.1 hypothetical protein MGYG_08918 [Nannizzia gypsea CBS 118893]
MTVMRVMGTGGGETPCPSVSLFHILLFEGLAPWLRGFTFVRGRQDSFLAPRKEQLKTQRRRREGREEEKPRREKRKEDDEEDEPRQRFCKTRQRKGPRLGAGRLTIQEIQETYKILGPREEEDAEEEAEEQRSRDFLTSLDTAASSGRTRGKHRDEGVKGVRVPHPSRTLSSLLLLWILLLFYLPKVDTREGRRQKLKGPKCEPLRRLRLGEGEEEGRDERVTCCLKLRVESKVDTREDRRQKDKSSRREE